jgi:hypothetical protein
VSEQLDLSLASDAAAVLWVLTRPMVPRELASASRLSVVRVAECLRWLERRGEAEWKDDGGPGSWRRS